MDIGIHVSLWTPRWDDPFTDYMVKAQDLGFDSVEIPIMDPESFPVGAVKRVLEDTGLRVSCGTGLGLGTDISRSDPQVREAGKAHLFRCLDIASELGSPSLQGVIHSAWGLHEQVSEDNRKYSAEVLSAAARHAASGDMRIALECINRYESSFLNTAQQGMHMLELIGEENAGLHLDTYHMNIEERSFADAFSMVGDRLFHLHLSENQRGFPGGGILDWKAIIQAAKSVGYAGPWIIESYVFPEFATGPDVCVWRHIEPEGDHALGSSLELLRAII